MTMYTSKYIFFFIICRMNLSEFLHVPSLLSVSKSLYNLWSFTLNRKGKQSIFTSIPLQWLCLFNGHETPSKFLYYVYAYNTFKYTDKFKENKLKYCWKNLFNCSWMSWFWCFPECLRSWMFTSPCKKWGSLPFFPPFYKSTYL